MEPPDSRTDRPEFKCLHPCDPLKSFCFLPGQPECLQTITNIFNSTRDSFYYTLKSHHLSSLVHTWTYFWISRLRKDSPQDVAMENPIVLTLRRRLPLHHDGLIGSPTGHDVFRGGTGGLLR